MWSCTKHRQKNLEEPTCSVTFSRADSACVSAMSKRHVSLLKIHYGHLWIWHVCLLITVLHLHNCPFTFNRSALWINVELCAFLFGFFFLFGWTSTTTEHNVKHPLTLGPVSQKVWTEIKRKLADPEDKSFTFSLSLVRLYPLCSEISESPSFSSTRFLMQFAGFWAWCLLTRDLAPAVSYTVQKLSKTFKLKRFSCVSWMPQEKCFHKTKILWDFVC